MRLIGHIIGEKQGHEFSLFLLKEGIENHCEILANNDWGSPEYGNVTCRIWIIDEDQVDKALNFLEEFQKNPSHPRFELKETLSPLSPLSNQQNSPPLLKAQQKIPLELQPLGPITLYILFMCIGLFMWGMTTTPNISRTIPLNIPTFPFIEPPINKKLLYDYPYAYDLVDRLVSLYGINKIENLETLPNEGWDLFEEIIHTPYWKGVYNKILLKTKTSLVFFESMNFQAPLFEKIKQGEIWRLITPCFLHASILHIFFNLIWLVVLGKQMEIRLKALKYVLFILISGVISNTAQYIMSGPNFIGISGVLCAMFAFVGMRQRYAPWEGYHLQSGTIAFLGLFIGAMFLIQLTSFFTEMYWQINISPGIANTAHLVGILVGILLGKMKYFAWNSLKT
jgi:GlpG protein